MDDGNESLHGTKRMLDLSPPRLALLHRGVSNKAINVHIGHTPT
jgi:hypothetical protein